jgi:hypothetical protein
MSGAWRTPSLRIWSSESCPVLEVPARIARHQSSHAKYVEHRLVHAVGSQRTEAFEVLLPFKLERPREHRDEVHLITVLQVEERLDHRSGVSRIQRPVRSYI